jgi:outer membrane receptor protein involved in Fe transport
MKKNNFVSPLVVETPLLLLNGQDIGAFIAAPFVAGRIPFYMGLGQTFNEALASATAEAAVAVPALATGLASLPVAVASSGQVNAQGADLILAYRNVGDVSLWGADVSIQWFLDDAWTVTGTYSHVSDDYFRITGGAPISLNAPTDKGTLGLAYRNVTSGFNAGARLRFANEFPAQSAGFVGTECITGGTGGVFEEPCVESSAIVDVNLGYRIPRSGLTAQLTVSNIFDSAYRSFVGVPEVKRFAMIRLKYDIF